MEESGFGDDFDGGAQSGDSEESGEEEMVEVSDGNQTLYFQSKDGMGQYKIIVITDILTFCTCNLVFSQ